MNRVPERTPSLSILLIRRIGIVGEEGLNAVESIG